MDPASTAIGLTTMGAACAFMLCTAKVICDSRAEPCVAVNEAASVAGKSCGACEGLLAPGFPSGLPDGQKLWLSQELHEPAYAINWDEFDDSVSVKRRQRKPRARDLEAELFDHYVEVFQEIGDRAQALLVKCSLGNRPQGSKRLMEKAFRKVFGDRAA